MRKLVFVFMFIGTLGFAQKTHLYLGVKTLHGVHAIVNYDVSEKSNIGIQMSYYHNLVDEMYIYTGSLLPVIYLFQGINQQGFGFGINYGFLMNNKKGKWHTITVEYQNLKSGIYISDEGKFAGTTMSDYDEYYDNYQNIAFSYRVTKPMFNTKWLEFFYEFGFYLSVIERQYTIEGLYSQKEPSDRKQDLAQILPFGRAGINFQIF